MSESVLPMFSLVLFFFALKSVSVLDCQLRFGGHLYWRAPRLLCIQYLTRRSRRKCVWYCDSGAEVLLCSYPFSFLQGRFYFLAKLCDLMKLTKIFKRGIINLLACRVFVLFKTSPVFFVLGQMSDSVLIHTLLSVSPSSSQRLPSSLYDL